MAVVAIPMDVDEHLPGRSQFIPRRLGLSPSPLVRESMLTAAYTSRQLLFLLPPQVIFLCKFLGTLGDLGRDISGKSFLK